jgi:hypothetical protein
MNETTSNEDSSAHFDHPTGLRLYVVFLALALSVLIVGLVSAKHILSCSLAPLSYSSALSKDASIIATATPRITDTFNSLSDVGWYGSS